MARPCQVRGRTVARRAEVVRGDRLPGASDELMGHGQLGDLPLPARKPLARKNLAGGKRRARCATVSAIKPPGASRWSEARPR
jgi:hypothetical protein